MDTDNGKYFKLLSKGELSTDTINLIHDHIRNQGLEVKPIDPIIYRKKEYGEKITEQLTRLNLTFVEGNPSWEGLIVGFPGKIGELSTKSVGTPYLRMILYPILDLHHRLQNELGKKLPCIYFIGVRFSDVFLRKFFLLNDVVPHIIVLTNDIYQCSKNKVLPRVTEKPDSESWTQMKLSQRMDSQEGLTIPLETKEIRIKFLSSEVPCSEGTEYPERLDILGYDASDHALVAFELKGLRGSRVELENLFLQALEHRNWIEKNKMALKLLFDRGPRGRRINTKKRVRLLLGFYGNKVPHLFNELRLEAIRRDSHLEIDYVCLSNDNNKVLVELFENNTKI